MQAASELYEKGDLDGAITSLNHELKQRPTDVQRRALLAELLCFAGALERADLQLDTLARQHPEVTLGVALFRQLLRAEQARFQWYTEGRVPIFVDGPDEHSRLMMEATLALHEGDREDAAKLAEEAEAKRPRAPGCMGEIHFDDFRDLDDLLGGALEVLTSTGQYYWVPVGRIIQIEFSPPQRLRDLLWRPAHMAVANGPEGEVFIPALYASPNPEHLDPRLRLGRATEWSKEGPPFRGAGQRMLLVGDEAVPVMQIEALQFDRIAQ